MFVRKCFLAIGTAYVALLFFAAGPSSFPNSIANLEIRTGRAQIVGHPSQQRQPKRPAASPERWQAYIGEYGPDRAVLYVLERDGRLGTLVGKTDYCPAEELTPDRFQFPVQGCHAGEFLEFHRSSTGKVDSVKLNGEQIERHNIGPAEGLTQLQIPPLRPVEKLLPEALSAKPPLETAKLRRPDLVELTLLDPGIKLEIRYASTNNFLGSIFYSQPRAFLQRPAAEALVRVNRKLKQQGFGLLVFDGYRPWYVTKVFWDATPEDKRIFVADPAKGSRHNRGCAVDLTLYELDSGKAVDMGGTYDETTDRSYPHYPGGTALQRWYRGVLYEAMESEGFAVYEAEWWHFDYRDWRLYPITNLTFEQIRKR
jgi:D-alanyl-D-alanine dipeptidase